MIINGVPFGVECLDIVQELQHQMQINQIPLLAKIVDTPYNVQVCCPYHKGGQERRPSAGIKKSDGTFHCLACGETHSLQEVVSHCFGHDDDIIGAWGWNWLRKNFVSMSVEERRDVEIDCSRNNLTNKGAVADSSAVDGFVTEEELDKYRYYHPYWTKRGITDTALIELFDLGYDPETACITMPIRDVNGNTVFVARRSVKTKWFNYPQGVHKPLYGLYELGVVQKDLDIHTQEIFICESMIDALLLWQSGFKALALNGLGSATQMEELKRLPYRKFILCTDNDGAGQKARGVLRKALKYKLITEIAFPENRKDVGECTREEIDNILQWEVFYQ